MVGSGGDILILISCHPLMLAGIYSYSYSYATHIPTDSARAGFIFIYRLAVGAPLPGLNQPLGSSVSKLRSRLSSTSTTVPVDRAPKIGRASCRERGAGP